MFEASYGNERFDLKLTLLRFIRNLHIIIVVTVLGTVIFGGGYYLKNIVFAGDNLYAATSVYKVEYTVEPSKTGDYYINEMSWNTYIQSKEFQDALKENLLKSGEDFEYDVSCINAVLASDIHIPSTTVVCKSERESLGLSSAVEKTMTGYFAQSNPQIDRITVIDPALSAKEVEPDVRPLRAFILSAVLTGFFAVVIFLIYEISSDGIWLPKTIRTRYGVKCAGTKESVELAVNLEHIFKDMKKIAVCPAAEEFNFSGAAKFLGQKLNDRDWTEVISPFTDTGKVNDLRQADGVLVLVGAGSHSGKKFERFLELMEQQDIKVTAAMLWDADEWLIRSYYYASYMRKVEKG